MSGELIAVKNPHAASAVRAFQNVRFEHTLHQLKPLIIPWMATARLLIIFGVSRVFSCTAAIMMYGIRGFKCAVQCVDLEWPFAQNSSLPNDSRIRDFKALSYFLFCRSADPHQRLQNASVKLVAVVAKTVIGGFDDPHLLRIPGQRKH